MRPARCLIVDDESPARDELRYLLRDVDGVEVVGEAATAEEARVLLDLVDYDVVLLDIRMPGADGLELAGQLQGASQPAIIFTTAYPDHAVEAFDLNAADYLVKPFDADRLRRALQRALAGGSDPEEPEERAVASEALGRIPVHKGDRIVLVDEEEIYYATAARGYAHLKLTGERVLVGFSLGELQERLSGHFFRTHRSYLVNLELVRELVPDFKGSLVVVMADREQSRVPVSRRQAKELRRVLGM
jgi:DNA-binding LytR/AlgR family response regulator